MYACIHNKSEDCGECFACDGSARFCDNGTSDSGSVFRTGCTRGRVKRRYRETCVVPTDENLCAAIEFAELEGRADFVFDSVFLSDSHTSRRQNVAEASDNGTFLNS